jgi:protocatechuate 3,4-dioxygenase beta subunit
VVVQTAQLDFAISDSGGIPRIEPQPMEGPIMSRLHNRQVSSSSLLVLAAILRLLALTPCMAAEVTTQPSATDARAPAAQSKPVDSENALDESDAQHHLPWAVEGIVADVQGHPLEGVQIRAARGWGTLHSTPPVSTDQLGRYVLRFGPGMVTKNEDTGQWRAGVQAASIFASKPGLAEKNLGRQGDLLMADSLPDKESEWDPKKIILPGKPYRLDFILVPAAAINGRFLDEQGQPLPGQRIDLTGDELPPSSSVAASTETDDKGCFQFPDVTPGFVRWLEFHGERKLALPRTQSLTLAAGEQYELTLQIVSDEATGQMLRIACARDSHGQDVLDKISHDDPRALPFLSGQLAANAREVLSRMAEVNKCWFGGRPSDVKSLEYQFHLADGEPRRITEQDYSDAKSWYREWYAKGISYTGAARVLASLRDRAKFRQVQRDEEQVTIYFVLQDLPSTVAAGNGIAGTWKGFFNAKMLEGVLQVDARRYTPISIEFGDRRELYDDYVEIKPGQFVPRRIQILSPGMDFDFRFRTLQPGLWLFDRSYGRWAPRAQDPVAWLTDVMVNAAPAVVAE